MERFLLQSGLGRPLRSEPLSGGVSSDIWRVELANGPVCVKRALPRLRVQQVWEAPVERNAYECEWLSLARETAPDAVPVVLARGRAAFAMEFLPPERYGVWKAELREGRADAGFAARVGGTLARIHAATSGRDEVAARFPTDALFRALRLDPYLVAAAARHADLSPALLALVEVTAGTRRCLVHGDVSPKNILCGPHGPVFLDAECAWYGDPAFDLAFCLNHLLLKCLWNPAATAGFLECFDRLRAAYAPAADVEARTARLLPGLLLARVDGKSPVEYLTEEAQKDVVRRAARELLLRPRESLEEIRELWRRSLP